MEISWIIHFFLIICLYSHASRAEIINKHVQRSLDLTSQLVKTKYTISIEEDTGKPIKEYIFNVKEPNLSHISAKDGFNNKIEIQPIKDQSENHLSYKLIFITLSASQTIIIETVSSKNILPHPSEIKQNDKQLVKFVGNLYLFSKYRTSTQKTNVLLSSSNLLSHSQAKPFTVSSNKLVFGPYENVKCMYLVIYLFLLSIRADYVKDIFH